MKEREREREKMGERKRRKGSIFKTVRDAKTHDSRFILSKSGSSILFSFGLNEQKIWAGNSSKDLAYFAFPKKGEGGCEGGLLTSF